MTLLRSAMALAVCAGAFASDFTYTERSEMTGGSLKRLMGIAAKFGGQSGPQTTVHRISGSKMASESGETRTVFDLSGETLTTVDLKKKEYSTITFEEMRQAMEAAMAKMQKARSDAKKEGQDVQMKWKVSVDRTGKTANVAGVAVEQAMMTMEMEMQAETKDGKQAPMAVNSMKIENWFGKPAGWEEAQKTMRTLAEKMVLNRNSGLAAMMQTAEGAAEGLAEASKEMAKIDGLPMRTITRMMGAGLTGGGGSEQSASQAEPPSAKEALIGGLGGFGRFGRKKPKKEEPKEEPKPQAQPSSGGTQESVLMELSSEVVSYSSEPVDAALFAVPPGFKQVEHPMRKMLEKQKR